MSSFDFIYGTSAPDLNGPFIKLPTSFFFGERFSQLSLLERVLYCALLDKTTLSRKRQCVDDSDRVYIELNRTNMAKQLGVSEKTLVTALVGLENGGLIQQVRRGQGKCNLVYVMDFASTPAAMEKTGIAEKQKLPNRAEKEDKNNINNINNNPRQSSISGSAEPIRMDEHAKAVRAIKEQIGYEKLSEEYEQDSELLDVVVSVMATVTTSPERKEYHISGTNVPGVLLREKLACLTGTQVSAVIKGILQHRTGGILNLRKYVLTCLYGAATSAKYACAGTGESDAAIKGKKNLFNDFHQREYSSSDWKRMEMAMLRKKWD